MWCSHYGPGFSRVGLSGPNTPKTKIFGELIPNSMYPPNLVESILYLIYRYISDWFTVDFVILLVSIALITVYSFKQSIHFPPSSSVHTLTSLYLRRMTDSDILDLTSWI